MRFFPFIRLFVYFVKPTEKITRHMVIGLFFAGWKKHCSVLNLVSCSTSAEDAQSQTYFRHENSPELLNDFHRSQPGRPNSSITLHKLDNIFKHFPPSASEGSLLLADKARRPLLGCYTQLALASNATRLNSF